jgi:RNA polymerase sigma-70 factor (ECF subfamily)
MPDIDKQTFDRDFEKLYGKYYSFLVKYLSGIVHDFDMAEDIAHDVFIRMYKNKQIPMPDDSRCKSYMIRSVKNMAIDYLRKQKRDELNARKNIPVWDGEINHSFDVEKIVIEGCILSTVSDVLSGFSERKSRIFRESVLEDRSYSEVCSGGGLSRYKVKKIETEIYRELKKKLKEYLK